MRKIRKIIRTIVLAVLIIVVVVAAAIVLWGESVLKRGIEAAGSTALGVDVSVNNVDLSILGGKVGLEDLLIDNPPGYDHDKLLELEDARIKVNVKSLLGDVVNIKEIKLDGMNLVVEQKDIIKNNLQEVIESIPDRDEQTEPSGKKLHIDTLEITDVTVKVNLLPVPGKVTTVPLKLKPIKMTDLGSDNKLDAVELSVKILLAIAGGIAEQGVGVLPDEILNPLNNELGRLGTLSGALLKEGGKILDGGTDLGKDLTEGIGGLLKPKKK
ncbi:MAG: AsmA family protein [Planctomycetota bacterium]|jgi:hypothetical protein